jgi:hypothetical protein
MDPEPMTIVRQKLAEFEALQKSRYTRPQMLREEIAQLCTDVSDCVRLCDDKVAAKSIVDLLRRQLQVFIARLPALKSEYKALGDAGETFAVVVSLQIATAERNLRELAEAIEKL